MRGCDGVAHENDGPKGAGPALCESQDVLRYALKAAGAGVWSWEIASDTHVWSQENEAIFGVASANVRTCGDWAALLHPDDRTAARKAVEAALVGTSPDYRNEYRIVRPDGEVRWILAHGRVERTPEGKPLRMLGINLDITDRRRAEAALESTLESIGDGFIGLDADWRFIYLNSTAEQILDIRATEVLGKSHWDVFAPTLGTRLEGEYRRAAQGETRDFENFYEPWQRWFHVRCFPRHGGGVSIHFQDITARKASEADLHRWQMRLGLALEGGQVGTWEWDVRSHEVIWNERMFDLYGQPLAGAQPESAFFESLHPEDRPAVRDSLTAVLEGGMDWRTEFRIVRPDGGVRWIVAVARLTRAADGTPLAMYGVNYDISERKEAESALRRSEARFRMLHESLRDAFVRTDMDGRLLEFNELYCQLLGYGADELHALTYSDLTPARWHAMEARILREQIIPRGYSDIYEMEYRRKDGTLIPVELRTVLARDAEGRPETTWAIVRDITERKANEARLRSLNDQLIHVARMSELSQVSAGISHELNQPLTAMLNYAGLARRLIADPDPASWQKARSAIEKAGEQAVRASEIVRRMRGFVERRETERKTECINRIAEEAVALALLGAKSDNVRTHLQFAPELPPVSVDRVQIQQVLVNLLHNAIDAMSNSQRRELTLCTKGTAAGVEVSVADTGPGVPKELAGRLFKPFVTTKSAGMGIGLAISRSIIEAHGGELTMRPNPEGGAIFRFTLPREAPPTP